MVYLDRFAGDFRGFEEKIPYLQELGVRLVHFMPFFRSPPGDSDGGYAVSDYLGVAWLASGEIAGAEAMD